MCRGLTEAQRSRHHQQQLLKQPLASSLHQQLSQLLKHLLHASNNSPSRRLQHPRLLNLRRCATLLIYWPSDFEVSSMVCTTSYMLLLATTFEASAKYSCFSLQAWPFLAPGQTALECANFTHRGRNADTTIRAHAGTSLLRHLGCDRATCSCESLFLQAVFTASGHVVGDSELACAHLIGCLKNSE